MHGFPFLNSPFAAQPAAVFIPVILVAIIWTIVIKGYALWIAARSGQKGWFIALLIVNTLGLLELVYIIWFRRTPPAKGESAPILSSSVQS
jgi:methionyl-tRNA synthetase